MTTREKLKKMLVDCGMFEGDANEVLKVAIPRIESLTPDYRITWDRPASEYPESVFNVMWLHVRSVALEWIDKHAPEAWFRPMFE